MKCEKCGWKNPIRRVTFTINFTINEDDPKGQRSLHNMKSKVVKSLQEEQKKGGLTDWLWGIV